MAETKKTTETKTVKSSEKATATKAAAPKKTTTTKTAATKATDEKKTTTAKKTTAKAVEAVKVEEVKVEAPKAEKKVAPAPKKANGPMIKVTLVKSGSGRLEKQIRTLKALGLNKTNSSNIVPDNAATRGMIFVVKHLVSVEEVK
jgi:large subunit ribosomal protein L30